jgi:hypothetical protein
MTFQPKRDKTKYEEERIGQEDAREVNVAENHADYSKINPNFWPVVKSLVKLREAQRLGNSYSKYFVIGWDKNPLVIYSSELFQLLERDDIFSHVRYVSVEKNLNLGKFSRRHDGSRYGGSDAVSKVFENSVSITIDEFERLFPRFNIHSLGSAHVENPLLTMWLHYKKFLPNTKHVQVAYDMYYEGDGFRLEFLDLQGSESFRRALQAFNSSDKSSKTFLYNKEMRYKEIITT